MGFQLQSTDILITRARLNARPHASQILCRSRLGFGCAAAGIIILRHFLLKRQTLNSAGECVPG
ncbi:uncharacterized protein B0I36DRAFT_329645 [Microdochium trichocladiopsis]|uniref:Uncharacterized protein n=1 Tax=Microdochium trichocladiopsis TaxID=1682393 RepID=A0A9P9BJW0_9PEZI|nr:uncharacterized protein B0I36DRAFT_329645 [Microdochium trichocladiopsis]KAH7025989.1 hypothetical protein B0I36DRAFT_329645 [Microdochium trichocladiopsis]